MIESWSDDGVVRRNLEATVEAFAATIELNDPGNASHGRRVAALAVAIGKEISLSATQLEGTRLAALIHDLGSFKIPVDVLIKPGKLTNVERLLVQSHPEVAHRILQGIEFLWPIAEIILQHHERIDGTGYPRGLAGSDMLIEAKIVAVADAMEAMLSDRPYRPESRRRRRLERAHPAPGHVLRSGGRRRLCSPVRRARLHVRHLVRTRVRRTFVGPLSYSSHSILRGACRSRRRRCL